MIELTKRQNEVATIIINQLGGRKFTAMTGAKDFSSLSDLGVQFKIGRNEKKVNTVTISLDEATDTYSMKFEKITLNRKTFDVKRKLISSCDLIYADMLQDVFTEETGMYTSL